MKTPQTDTVISHESLERHEQIHFFLDRLGESVKDLDAEAPDADRLARLAAVIASLMEQIREHNTLEERLLFQGIVDRIPDAEDEILELSDEHRKILEILEMARIHALKGAPDGAAGLKSDMSRYLDMIRKHEKAEEDLLRRALEQENRGLPATRP